MLGGLIGFSTNFVEGKQFDDNFENIENGKICFLTNGQGLQCSNFGRNDTESFTIR